MTKIRFVCAALVVSSAGFVTSLSVGRMLAADQPRSRASWVYKTNDPAKMARDVDAIVVGEWRGVSPGRTVEGPIPEASLAFELNTFAVEEVLKGEDLDESIAIERVASQQRGRRTHYDHDGGPFAPHTRYLLFLKKAPGASYYIQVNDEARYVLDGRARLRSSVRGRLADGLKGRSLADVRGTVRRALDKQ